MSKTVSDCGGIKLPKIVVPVKQKATKKKTARKGK